MSKFLRVTRWVACGTLLLLGALATTPASAQTASFGNGCACGCKERCPRCFCHFFWRHHAGPYGRPFCCGTPCGTECSCPPQGPFFGYFPTCWRKFPQGWEECPVQNWDDGQYLKDLPPGAYGGKVLPDEDAPHPQDRPIPAAPLDRGANESDIPFRTNSARRVDVSLRSPLYPETETEVTPPSVDEPFAEEPAVAPLEQNPAAPAAQSQPAGTELIPPADVSTVPDYFTAEPMLPTPPQAARGLNRFEEEASAAEQSGVPSQFAGLPRSAQPQGGSLFGPPIFRTAATQPLPPVAADATAAGVSSTVVTEYSTTLATARESDLAPPQPIQAQGAAASPIALPAVSGPSYQPSPVVNYAQRPRYEAVRPLPVVNEPVARVPAAPPTVREQVAPRPVSNEATLRTIAPAPEAAAPGNPLRGVNDDTRTSRRNGNPLR